MKSKDGIWKLKYPHCNSQENINKKILNELKVELYGFVSCHESLVKSLMAAAHNKFELGIITRDICRRESPGNQLLALFDVIESLALLTARSRNRDPRKDLIELLLNFNDCHIIADFTRIVVRKHCELVIFEDDTLADDLSEVEDSDDKSRPAACTSNQTTLLALEDRTDDDTAALPKLGHTTRKRKAISLVTMLVVHTIIILYLVVINTSPSGQVLTSIGDPDSIQILSARGNHTMAITETSDETFTSLTEQHPTTHGPLLFHFNSPNNGTLNHPKLQRISKVYLRGHMNVDEIIKVLNQSANATRVVFSNKFNQLCSYNENIVMNNTTVVLMRTVSLTIDYFHPPCAAFCQNLITKIHMPNLKIFAVKNGFINDQNKPCLQRLLKNNFKQITCIKFVNTTAKTMFSLFNVQMANSLKNVRNVYLDFISNFATPTFSEVLPKVNKITSKLGFISVPQLQFLLACKHLSNVTIAIKLNSSRHFHLTHLRTGFAKLKHLNLELLHDTCNNRSMETAGNALQIENLDRLNTEHLRTVNIRSKCRLSVTQFYGVLDGQWEGNHTISGGYYSCYYKFKSKNQTVNHTYLA